MSDIQEPRGFGVAHDPVIHGPGGGGFDPITVEKPEVSEPAPAPAVQTVAPVDEADPHLTAQPGDTEVKA